MKYYVTKEQFKIVGRSFMEGTTCYLSYSGASVAWTFKGTKAEVTFLSNPEAVDENLCGMVAFYVNDEEEPRARFRLGENRLTYTLFESQTEETMTITLMKYSEAPMGLTGIESIDVEGELLPPPPMKERKIEMIGDSITCGYGVEAEGEWVPFDTRTENPTKSYSLLTAKALEAEACLVSWSGNGLITHYVEESAIRPDDQWLMQEIYPYTDLAGQTFLHGKEQISSFEKWNEDAFVPQLVLINIGTNDGSWCKDIKERKDVFVERYEEFIKQVRAMHPQAMILGMLGTMDQRLIQEFELGVAQYQAHTGDERIACMVLPQQNPEDGCGADWHPSPVTQMHTKDLVVAKIREIMNW